MSIEMVVVLVLKSACVLPSKLILRQKLIADLGIALK